MIIQDLVSIKDIQQEFHKMYPGLKMVFYRSKHHDHQGSDKAEEYTSDHILRDIRQRHTEGSIEIKPQMTVKELEYDFEELYGLHIQIFRKSGAVWLQTIATDDWTLAKQNEKGLSLDKEEIVAG
ncbi:MAG: hypothetical protein KDC53_11515 [Saprospiraceae bacterium]|nr:hypothetical protein [Saprospiraceae bacterium]